MCIPIVKLLLSCDCFLLFKRVQTMLKFLIILLHLTGLFFCDGLLVPEDTITVQNYVFWPNATVPFYINPNHFDQEQALTIMTTLSQFAFKTCLKFAPVMAEPQGNDHVMVFENPGARWKCTWSPEGHSIDEPHRINLGYECLKTPRMEMTIMKALGFPFEHNRASRDLFIDVQLENVEPSAMELFTKDTKLPIELRNLPYDVNSVTHFGDRDFSKNGHRTFIIKDRNLKQNRIGLSDIDLRKIQLVYGPECQKRDRQEKIELCQIYPGVARKKREAEFENENLRVNRDITPPPENKLADDVDKTLNELGIKQEVEEIIDKVHNVIAVAVENTRKKYCNKTEESVKAKRSLKSADGIALTPGEIKVLNITAAIADFAQSVVDASKTNLSHFCLTMDLLEQFPGRGMCQWGSEDPRCPLYYRSTKSGAVKHHTQHRPVFYPSTKHKGQRAVYQYGLRSDNVTDSQNGTAKRKREAHDEGIHFKDSINIKAGDKQTRILDEKDVKDRKKESDRKVSKKILRSVSTIKNVKKRHYVTRRSEDQRFRIYSHTFTKADDDYSTSKENAKRKKLYQDDEDDYNDGKQNVWYYGKQKKASDDDSSSQGATKNSKKTFKDDSDEDYYEKKKIGISSKNKYEKISKDDFTSQEKVKKNKKVHRDESVDDKHEGIKKHKKDRNFKQKIIINRESKNSRPIPRTVTLSKANKEFYADRKWPGGVVRYVITEYDEYDLPDLRSRLEEVNNILREETCVRLQELSEEQAKNYEDYLVLDTSPDYVTGRVGGRQVFGSVELFKGVSHKQHTAMMVMAMLGFYFEVSRHDRDDYIVVHSRHIRPDKLHHFEKIRSDATLPIPYDYDSATHPSWQFWRKIGKTGISSVATFKDKDPDGSVMKKLGQHQQLLSDTDILKINSVYGVQCFKKQQRHRV